MRNLRNLLGSRLKLLHVDMDMGPQVPVWLFCKLTPWVQGRGEGAPVLCSPSPRWGKTGPSKRDRVAWTGKGEKCDMEILQGLLVLSLLFMGWEMKPGLTHTRQALYTGSSCAKLRGVFRTDQEDHKY